MNEEEKSSCDGRMNERRAPFLFLFHSTMELMERR